MCISTLDRVATTGFQEVAAVLALIGHQIEAHSTEHSDTMTIITALNAVLEMTERYLNQMQWISDPYHREPDHLKTSAIRTLQSAVIDMDLMATDGFSEINAIARLALSKIEDSQQDWKQLGIAISALVKTAHRYQECVSDQIALADRSNTAPDHEQGRVAA